MKQFIYILTDSNRRSLHVGLTQDLIYTMNYYKERHLAFFDSPKAVSRLVYLEETSTLEMARNRFKEISAYTRTQKEKIIRLKNMDWKDLSLQNNIVFESESKIGSYKNHCFAS